MLASIMPSGYASKKHTKVLMSESSIDLISALKYPGLAIVVMLSSVNEPALSVTP
jgi:hypothetical protein